GHAPHELLELGNLAPLQHVYRVVLVEAGRAVINLALFVAGRVAHEDLEEQAVELCVGERIGRFLFERVLCGQDEGRSASRGPGAGCRRMSPDVPAWPRAARPAFWAGCG